MNATQAWAIFRPELEAVTIDNWTEEDYAEEPAFERIAEHLHDGRISDVVLDEIESCTTRDWCTGRVLTAALTVLAAHGRLDRDHPEHTVYSRRPRTRILLGIRWIVG